ncbi:MAG: hypothetical protein RSF67_08240, partial [Clostridia bacterium]
FLTIVIGDNVDNQLACYDENIEVEVYVTKPVSNEDKERFISYYNKNTDTPCSIENFDEAYKKYGSMWNRNHWKKINDTWMIVSNYNKLSKWDWYVIGGRWSCYVIKNKKGEFCNQEYIQNITNINEIKPFAIVINGKWYEKGEMGWWGSYSPTTSDEDWEKEVYEKLSNLPENTLITVVDCHI